MADPPTTSGISFQARLNRDVEPRAADADIVSVCKNTTLMSTTNYIDINLSYLLKNNYAFSYTTSTGKLFRDDNVKLSTLSIASKRATWYQNNEKNVNSDVNCVRLAVPIIAADLTALAPHLTANARNLTAWLLTGYPHLEFGLYTFEI